MPFKNCPSHRRLLVIDDNRAIHDDFRKILCGQADGRDELEAAEAGLYGNGARAKPELHFELECAAQGEEGLKVVQQAVAANRRFSVAFVDVRMPPGWDGIETAVKLWQADPDLQIVICTAFSDYSWEEIVQRLGPSDRLLILKKPFDMVEVLQLANALSHKWLLGTQVKARLDELDGLVKSRTAELSEANHQLLGDIESRKRAEEALRISEERFRSVWERTNDGMRLTDREGLIIDVNEAYCHLVGLPREKLVRQIFSVTYAGHGPNDGLDVYRQRFDDRDVLPRLNTRVKLWNQQAVDLEISNSFIELGGHGRLVLSIFRDVTQRNVLEQQFRQAQKMEAIGQLAGGVAHDFNNLLAVIRGNTELILLTTSEKLGPKPLEYLKQVVTAADRATNLTRQLLAFSRKQVMQAEPLNLNEVIGNLTKMLTRIIGEDVHLHCAYAARLPLVKADVGMIEQVVVNMVVNARDAMARGGQLLITTDRAVFDEDYCRTHPTARPGEFARVAIEDSGTGIARQHLPHIFEPFFTTKQPGKGTGLGLATAYGIVQQHDGWIDVETEEGKGTTFTVFLPATQAAAVRDEKIIKVHPRGGDETILLVEDDEAVREVTRRTLEGFGYRVCEATSGREALDLWSDRLDDVDLLLTDLIMPNGVDGRELAERMRHRRPDLRVLFMSGWGGTVNVNDTQFMQKNAGRFLQKPCPSDQLLDTIRKSLDAA
jgi:two-component system, cell cycle sensor histidine kinase and response regulator CckA